MSESSTEHGFINEVAASDHGGRLTFDLVRQATEDFTKPAVFRDMVPIDPRLTTRAFYEVDVEDTLQWRRKQGEAPVTLRSADRSKADYNYVSGQVGTGREFLDDIFERNLDVYSHLGTISAGYKDPYPWGKKAFERVKESIFSTGWFAIDHWQPTGHMFFGYSNDAFGEPTRGAVGSDWHMFPTLNVFVMIAGLKKWMTHPPYPGEQLGDDSNMFPTSSGREAPGGDFEKDTIHVEPGDVLVNLPYEWHKVLNARGLNLGAAFRIIDTDYVGRLAQRLSVQRSLPGAETRLGEDIAHLLTSLSYASRDPRRAQMLLNELEYTYPALQAKWLEKAAAKPASGQAAE
ncbi:MAG: hypothetical protein RID91_18315 [Azospirillaceae bacterium]